MTLPACRISDICIARLPYVRKRIQGSEGPGTATVALKSPHKTTLLLVEEPRDYDRDWTVRLPKLDLRLQVPIIGENAEETTARMARWAKGFGGRATTKNHRKATVFQDRGETTIVPVALKEPKKASSLGSSTSTATWTYCTLQLLSSHGLEAPGIWGSFGSSRQDDRAVFIGIGDRLRTPHIGYSIFLPPSASLLPDSNSSTPSIIMPPLANKRKHSDLTQSSSSTQRTTRSMAAANPDIHILADGIDKVESPSKRQRMGVPSGSGSSLDCVPITPVSLPRDSRRRVSRETNTHTLASAQDSLQLVPNAGTPSRPRVPLRRRGPPTPTPASKTHSYPFNAPLGRSPTLAPTIADDDSDDDDLDQDQLYDDDDDEDEDEFAGIVREPSMTHFIGAQDSLECVEGTMKKPSTTRFLAAQDSLECVENMLLPRRAAPLPRRRLLPTPSPLSLAARIGPSMPTPAPSSPLHPSIQNIDAIQEVDEADEEDVEDGLRTPTEPSTPPGQFNSGHGERVFHTPTEPATSPGQFVQGQFVHDPISRPITPITNGTPSPSADRTSLPPHPLPPLPSFPALPSISGDPYDDLDDVFDFDMEKGDSEDDSPEAGMNWAALCLPAPSPLYNHTKDPVDLPRSAVLDAARDARRAYRKHLTKAYKYYTRVVAAQHALSRPRGRSHTHPRAGKALQRQLSSSAAAAVAVAAKKVKSQQALREKPGTSAMGMEMGMSMGFPPQQVQPAPPSRVQPLVFPPKQVQPKPPSKVQVQVMPPQQVQPQPQPRPPQQVQPRPPQQIQPHPRLTQQVQPRPPQQIQPHPRLPQQLQPRPPQQIQPPPPIRPKPQLQKLQTPQRKKLSLKEQRDQQRELFHMSMERMGSLTLE
ncbi:hypothetical protein CONPUDRAFT_140732 [Coniophora puteana RWD-64-598 SS2]|uniref:Uncharacterized protein n=1 Tax=Coniophora puteana (strain RWD-64-598) TaxID=741705 RepID=A0A5M3N3D8_CONPW|nr:uncharacterized protein CONPUDRAFT_140732 [Coniophora puteana RWD-64-598 SS2]EIW85929.1 hypothetical protein CONPUDRAFT_140732 [Coniophora puteana RWD-64-598 SS2]